ncbi:MAG: hypothetical protein LBK66_00345 [Spirochaetaceae bacterium]|jgi:hypothetical protein|nr:hypothetical protein [Spirochaetaceae bacterium]
MEKKNFVRLGMLAIMLTLGLAVMGCKTTSSIGGTVDDHGLFSSADAASSGGDVIASYGVILGLVDSGYESYVASVKAAEAAGKTVTSVTTQYLGFYTKVVAYAQ